MDCASFLASGSQFGGAVSSSPRPPASASGTASPPPAPNTGARRNARSPRTNAACVVAASPKAVTQPADSSLTAAAGNIRAVGCGREGSAGQSGGVGAGADKFCQMRDAGQGLARFLAALDLDAVLLLEGHDELQCVDR